MLITDLEVEINPPLTYCKATVVQNRDAFYLIYSYGSCLQKIKEDRNYITEVYTIYPTLNSANPLEWDRGAIIYQREVPTPEADLADEMHNYAVSNYSK